MRDSKYRLNRILGILGLFVFSFVGQAFAASLTVDEESIAWNGNDVTINIVYASGGDDVSSMDFDLSFDDSKLTLSSISAGAAATAAGKSVVSNAISSSASSVVIYGLNANTLSDGVLLTLSLSLENGASDGDAAISLSSIVGASSSAASVSVTSTSGNISVDTTAPTITVTSPSDGATFSTSEITVEGTVDDNTISTITINGSDYDVTDGAFSETITLSAGSNTLSLSVTDGSGNEGTASLTVTYLLGDVNEDGIVDQTDVTSAVNMSLGTVTYDLAADINSDGVVNVIDIQQIINQAIA